MDDRIEFLASTDLLRGVSEPLLREIEAGMAEVSFASGERIFDQGEPGDAVYVVVDGKVALESEGVRLLTRGAGECVGEFALIDDEPRSASVVAVDDVRLLRWERAAFQATLAREPGVARGIFRLLTAKLREDVQRRAELVLERERWQHDLARAREIQLGMLPSGPYRDERLELFGWCTPASEVGGDFFDWLPIGGGRVAVIIGDVTGHGFYSGLFVAMAKSCLHTQARFDTGPVRVMEALRRALVHSIHGRLLMACFYVVIDPARGRMRYANAGHPWPLHWRAAESRVARLESIDPILGARDADAPAFEERECEWSAGDRLVLYSDGILETRDARGRMLGEQAIESVLRSHARCDARGLRDTILRIVHDHARDVAQRDDRTLVVVGARA